MYENNCLGRSPSYIHRIRGIIRDSLLCFISGVSKQGGVKNSVNVLRRLVFTAARIGAEQFIRLIFGTSAGHTVYETYKNESIFPEDIATSNGHDHIAAYLETQSKKYANYFLTLQR